MEVTAAASQPGIMMHIDALFMHTKAAIPSPVRLSERVNTALKIPQYM
ncbi:MAG: hypothetical protein WCG21_12625 [Eubacteriales bacterium]